MDNDEFGFGFDFSEYTKNLQEAAEAADRSQMASEVLSHEIFGFIEELTGDHLEAFIKLMNTLMVDPEPNIMVTFLYGVALAHRQHKHDVCISCGKNHTDAMLGLDGP